MPENVVPDRAQYGSQPEPTTIKKQLKALNAKIAGFEAEKNAEKQAALTAFDEASDHAVGAYEAAYVGLHGRWCDQQQRIEVLYRRITGGFPTPWKPWKEQIIACICAKLQEVAACEQHLAQQIYDQKTGAVGATALALDDAKAAVLVADAHTKDLLANAEKADGLLTANDAMIESVKDLLDSADPATALYPFWFQLLPAHQQLRPDDVPTCMKFDGPDKLCGKESREQTAPPRALPWLMPKESYLGALFAAWTASGKAKADLAAKEAALQAVADGIAALEQELEKLNGSLEERINDCLKNQTPSGNCCTTGRGPNGANDA